MGIIFPNLHATRIDADPEPATIDVDKALDGGGQRANVARSKMTTEKNLPLILRDDLS